MLDWLKTVNDFTKAALIVHIVLFVAIALDLAILRQIVGFIYLTFIPGLAIMRILRLQKLVLVEKIVFSVGLSIAFLMFLGFVINQFYYIGFLRPLSAFPVIATVTAATLPLCVASGYVNKGSSVSVRLGNANALIPCVLFAIFLPILSVSGVFLVNTVGNNVLLLLLIVIISASFSLGVYLKGVAFSEFSPFILFGISLALLLHVSLLSPYIYGYDVHTEYYVFGLTAETSHWNQLISTDWRTMTYNAMLSVTVLPTIYKIFLDSDNSWILKVVYPLVYSLVPLGLYQIYKKQMGNKIAFVSAFFFMAFFGFYQVLVAVAKQMIGELFFVLLLLVTTSMDKDIPSEKSTVLFLIFSGALVVSHYSMSYIFFFYISLVLLFSFIRKTRLENITLARVALFFAMAFSWYIYTSNSAPFEAIQRVGNNVSGSLSTELFSTEGRESLALAGLGGGIVNSPGHLIGRYVQYLPELLIVIGVVKLLYDDLKHKEIHIDRGYSIMAVISMLLLAMSIVLPNFSSGLRIERIFGIVLIFLAPFCYLGVDSIFHLISRLKTANISFPKQIRVNIQSIVVMAIFLMYFLYNVGFVYEVTRDFPSSVALSGYRMEDKDPVYLYNSTITFYSYVTLKDEVLAARWLSINTNPPLSIFSDMVSRYQFLNSYGMFPTDYLHDLSLTTPSTVQDHQSSYLVLRKLNVVDGIFQGEYRQVNSTELRPYLDYWNKVYSNAYSEVYNDPSQGQP